MAWSRPQPVDWLRRHPRWADWLLAVPLTVVGVVGHVLDGPTASPSPERDAVWWSVLLAIAAVLPVAWRRTHPVEVAVVVTIAQVTFTYLDFEGPGFIGVIVALYSVGAHAHGRRRSVVLWTITGAITALFVTGLLVDELDLANFVSGSVVLVTSFVLGDNLRRRRDAATAMVERAERAERERDLLATQRVSAERARIARELHDVVAHSVSSMVIQAGAGRRNLDAAPERSAEALGNIEQIGRRTMDELRSILGVLRASEALGLDVNDLGDDGGTDGAGRRPAAPQPTIADLAALVEETADLPVRASIADDLGDVPSSVGLVAYRLVQEALTNVRRHGGEVEVVTVDVERRGDTLVVDVVDDGRGLAADETSSPGYGIQGMHERVAAIGGEIVARHRTGGGWQVSAELPLGPRQRGGEGARPTTPGEVRA